MLLRHRDDLGGTGLTAGVGARVALAAIIGLAVGALTQLGQGLLPGEASQVANAISPWLLMAFLLGSLSSERPAAAVTGIVSLFGALAGYDLTVWARYGMEPNLGGWVFWGTGAVVGGIVFGVAGSAWRFGTPRDGAIALGLLVAVAVSEGVYNVLVVAHPLAGIGFVVAGLLVPLLLGRSRTERTRAYVAAVPWLGLGALGYLVFGWLSTLAVTR